MREGEISCQKFRDLEWTSRTRRKAKLPFLAVGLLTPQETSNTRLASQKLPNAIGLTVFSRGAYSSLNNKFGVLTLIKE